MDMTTPTLESPETDTTSRPARARQVDAASGKKPKVVAQMSDWQYLERSLHRMIAGWGRHFPAWEDKIAACRHVWEQSECVRRLRERLAEFPGTNGNQNAPVSARLETLVNMVLLAPSHEDAIDGIYQVLSGALFRSYLSYVESAHPVHDAPTVALLQEIVRVKEQQRLWLRGYRRRHPHTTDAAYAAAIERVLADCGNLTGALPVEGKPARPVGIGTLFRPSLRAAKPESQRPRFNLMTEIERDFTHSVEARRLFWCYGYMMEQNLADEQLVWIYDAYDMPWEFMQDVSRHLWDESRHGNSGHSRLLDFGITLERIGFPDYAALEPQLTDPEWGKAGGVFPELTPLDLYNKVFGIGMVAETGHFPVKHEGYADFKEGGDMESAEMMLFDIIDETTHVQYAHRWLPVLAARAGVPDEDYRQRGLQERKRCQQDADIRLAALQATALDTGSDAYAEYQALLKIARGHQLLSNEATCLPRLFKPM